MTLFPDQLSPNQDEFYDALMDAHNGLSEKDSHALNARIILLMANVIGDFEKIKDILNTAQTHPND
ncbi:MAG: DUF2783 domain-containing protein [Aestuariivita sp.]|nr:DUF2783 domain-containing protein [Aestuariivita sp.]